MWSEKQPIRTLTSAIRRCLFPKSPKTFRAYFGCHNHRRSQDFLKGVSHCVKVRVHTRLSCRPPRRVFDLKKVFKKGLFNYGQDIVTAFSPPEVGCLVKTVVWLKRQIKISFQLVWSYVFHFSVFASVSKNTLLWLLIVFSARWANISHRKDIDILVIFFVT